MTPPLYDYYLIESNANLNSVFHTTCPSCIQIMPSENTSGFASIRHCNLKSEPSSTRSSPIGIIVKREQINKFPSYSIRDVGYIEFLAIRFGVKC
ncbi:hypothetical protein DERF_009822 [Dermatophagoides farinae]|uniref:Uncharacterized protein n=1 Tax=Dermatophagoides farinae TaxID=6954 RepID=A0A922HUS8_DERFA|nr:hypothetical protein DERF_009822 [Dermatophagoides farinae]